PYPTLFRSSRRTSAWTRTAPVSPRWSSTALPSPDSRSTPCWAGRKPPAAGSPHPRRSRSGAATREASPTSTASTGRWPARGSGAVRESSAPDGGLGVDAVGRGVREDRIAQPQRQSRRHRLVVFGELGFGGVLAAQARVHRVGAVEVRRDLLPVPLGEGLRPLGSGIDAGPHGRGELGVQGV